MPGTYWSTVDNIDPDTERQEQMATHEPVEEVGDGQRSRTTARDIMDVGIESISDIDAENYIAHYPGTTVHMNLTLRNYGDVDISTPFDVLLTISDGTTRGPSYHYQENRTYPAALNLPALLANTSYNISWNWTTPLSMPHGCEKNFSLGDVVFVACFTTLLERDMNSNNNQNCIDIRVEQPDFLVNLIPGWKYLVGKERVTEPQEDFEITIESGQTNQFELKFSLENFGEATFINFSVISPNDWKAIPPARQFWQSRSNSSVPSMNLTVTVFPSVNREHLQTATWHTITLKAVAESYPLAFDTLTFRGKVTFMPYPKIIPPEIPDGNEVYFIRPGEADINFRVYNKGNGEDNFECKAQVGETPFETKWKEKEGWRAVVHSGKYTRILSRGEHQIVTVRVLVPATVRAGSPCGIKLTATSVKEPEHRDGEKNFTFYIFADLFKDATIDSYNDKSIPMYPNSEVSTMLRIRNTGNKADRSIRMNVTSIPEGWDVIIDSSDIPPGGLPRNGTADIEVIINTPKKVVESKYEIKIGAMADDQIRDEISLSVQVLKVRKISLQCKNARETGNVSEKISYLITVENKGNARDSIDLRYSYISIGMNDMNWKVVLSKNFTTLYPYESRDVIISVFIPLEALADTDFLTPTLDGYFIQIRGISQNDTSVTSEKEIEVVVNPIYEFGFTKQNDRKYLILHHTQTVDYTFGLENKGNDLDWYDISYESEYDWITIPYAQRKLHPGVMENLFINFDPPATLNVGEYEFTIKSKSAKVPSMERVLNLTIEIIEFDLALTELRIGDTPLAEVDIKEGETVLLRAKLENVGDLDYFNRTIGKPVIIKFTESQNYLGEVNITYLSNKDSGNNSVWVGLSWKIGKARTYELSVEVDPGEKIPESKRTNNKIKGKIDVKGGSLEDDTTGKASASDMTLIISLIIIFIIIMIMGLWGTYKMIKRGEQQGYTSDGEYKPYEDTSKAEFDKDDEEDEEPEGGVLGVQGAHPYSAKPKDKFMSDVTSMITMKTIRKTKPIKKSKPITSLGRPNVAGYLPPMSKTSGGPAAPPKI